MASRMVANLTVILSVILISATTIASFDITKLLQKHGDFSNFNDLLTQTGLAGTINNRQTITVLAVDNSGMGSITSKPQEVAKNILATHVLLDYYDTKKLADMASSDKPTTLTNLFQTTGAANGDQGSLKVTTSGKDVVVGSAVNGAPHEAKVVNSIESQPYNISVLQISQLIVTPGLDHISPAGSPKASTPAESPKKAHHDGKAPSSESSDDATAPAGSPKGGADADDAADKKSPPPMNDGARITSVGSVTVLASMGLVAWAL